MVVKVQSGSLAPAWTHRGIMLIGSGLVGPSPGAGAKGFPDKLQVTSGKSDVLS